jgi:hypothetical protein
LKDLACGFPDTKLMGDPSWKICFSLRQLAKLQKKSFRPLRALANPKMGSFR